MGLQTFFDNFALLSDAPNGVAKLRELILQLAVEGRLIPQNSKDQSAKALLKKIETEKEKLTGKPISIGSSVQEADAPYVIPISWIWTTLEQVGFINPRNEFDDDELASFVPMKLIPQKYGGRIRTETQPWKAIKKGFTHFAENDVVLAKITPCFQNGKAAVMRELENNVGAGTTELHVFRPVTNLMVSEYVLIYLKSPQFILNGIPQMTGTAGQKRLPSSYFGRNPFPLPPFEEQKRIVAKVDELMGLCDDLEERQRARRESRMRLNDATLAPLNSAASLAPEQFEQATTRLADNFTTLYESAETVGKLRSTILQLAVHGELVAQNPADEPARVLLKEIGKEKERQIQERKSKQIEPLPEITESDNLNVSIPRGWTWAWLGDLARFVDYRGKTPAKTERGVKLITAKNVRMGFISEHPREFISEASYAEVMTRGFPKVGDILFTTEAPLGNVAQILIDEKIALAQRVIDLQTFKPLFAEYLKVCLMSPLLQGAIIERATGMTATGIKASKLKLLPVPVPPLNEQKRIVAKVNHLMMVCDELETKLRQAETDSEKLMDAAVQHFYASINKETVVRTG